jgi:hypothetical protein
MENIIADKNMETLIADTNNKPHTCEKSESILADTRNNHFNAANVDKHPRKSTWEALPQSRLQNKAGRLKT